MGIRVRHLLYSLIRAATLPAFKAVGLAPSKAGPAAALALCAFAGFALASCPLASPIMAVALRLPPFPEAWASAEFWELRVEQGGQPSDPLVARPGDTVVLALPRRSNAFVYCAALLGGGKSLPFGAVWPQQGKAQAQGGHGAALSATASGGLAATFGALLERSGYAAGGFNLERFGLEAEARTEDPWTLDLAGLAQSVAGGSFRADSLRDSPEQALARLWLPLRLAGAELLPSSPWAQALLVAADGSLDLELCYKPRSLFGGGYEIRAGLSPEGEPCWSIKELSGAGGL